MKKALSVLCLLCAFLLTGCFTSHYRVAVKTTVNPDPQAAAVEKTYVLRPMDDKIDPDQNALYKELAPQVNALLAQKGYILVDDPAKASQVVLLLYLSGAQNRVVTENVPYYAPTGTTARRSGDTIYYTPSYQVAGYRQQTKLVTTHQAAVTLRAERLVDGKIVEADQELWKAMAASVGPDSSLREIFPALLNALKDRIGTSFNATVAVAAEK